MIRIVIILPLLLPGFLFAQEQSGIQVDVLTETTASWNGAALPAWPGGSPVVSIHRYLIPGNTTLPWHRHPVMSAGYLLSGRLTVTTRAGERIELVAGDTVVETVDTWHQGTNAHAEPAEIIVFYAGAVNTPLTIQEQ